LLSEAELKRITDSVLGRTRADQASVLLFDTDSALTRFANNEIHQNVAERDTGLLVQVVFGKKVGVASINRTDDEGITEVLRRAEELARHQIDNPEFRSLPAPKPFPAVASSFSDVTADCLPERRARGVEVIVRRAMEHGLVAAGAFSTSASQIAVANSLGLFASHRTTEANINTVVMSDSSSGYADRLSFNVNEIDAEAVAAEAVQKALRGRDPKPLEPGLYEVVLEEYAVSDIVDFVSDLGFSALAVQEERSFMVGRLGQRVLGENISIWDDGLANDTIAMPFDYEGTPKQRVNLIERGIACGLLYDTMTAQREGKESTGHGLPPGSVWGPVGMHLHLAPGTASKEELIRSVKRGLLVTRFWYTRTVHPLSITVTGMTRDGAFLIENGEIVTPVSNLRFTQSYLEALNHVDLIGRESQLKQTMYSYNRVPALKIAQWEFTGSSER